MKAESWYTLTVPADAVVAHQISATETYGHRLATQGRDSRAGPLRVDMQVRLSGISAVTDETEHVSEFRDFSYVHGDTAPLHVPQDNPHRSAFENGVMPAICARSAWGGGMSAAPSSANRTRPRHGATGSP